MTRDIVDCRIIPGPIIPAAVAIGPAAISVSVSIVGAEALAVYGHEHIVMPSLKAFAVLDSGCFVVGVAHGQKYGGLGHALGYFSLAHQILMLGAEIAE